MPRLNAGGQGSEAPAHRQLRHCPAGARLAEGLNPGISNVVAVEPQFLCIAHQTKRLGQENVHTKSQGFKARGWGVS